MSVKSMSFKGEAQAITTALMSFEAATECRQLKKAVNDFCKMIGQLFSSNIILCQKEEYIEILQVRRTLHSRGKCL